VADIGTGPNRDREFYDSVYGNFGRQLTATIRAEVFEQDIGQNSWLTAAECRRFWEWLGLDGTSEVLEIGSGTGGPALFMARETGCSVIGVELHEAGVQAANTASEQQGLRARARFFRADARDPLGFAAGSFDVVLCVDSINHMYERSRIFEDWRRVLRAGGRVLFTDPLTLTGMISQDELVIRSGRLGNQVFTPPGIDEELLRAAGFDEVRVVDVTAGMATVSAARRNARAHHVAELDELEGPRVRVAYDRYLHMVEVLAKERRLTRLAYLARKP
jgi:cyclopropane fatty-acyl-phospholipid synthase-like methyltransferase